MNKKGAIQTVIIMFTVGAIDAYIWLAFSALCLISKKNYPYETLFYIVTLVVALILVAFLVMQMIKYIPALDKKVFYYLLYLGCFISLGVGFCVFRPIWGVILQIILDANLMNSFWGA